MSGTIGVNARILSVDEPGGAAHATIELVNHLRNQELTLFGHDSIRQRIDGDQDFLFESSYCYTPSQVYGLFYDQILPMVAPEDIDVLFCPNSNGPIRPIDFPVVLSIHNVNALRGFSSATYTQLQRFLVPKMAMNADSIITVSNFAKQELCDIMSINEDKIQVVYNGINDLFFDPSPGEPFALPDDYFLYVGALNENKNISGLINGYLHGRKEYGLSPDLVLIGGNKNGIYKSVDNNMLGESNHIHRFDYRSQEELKYAYDNASAFVHPSHYESCPLVAIEAMARGLPSVSSNRAGLPEIFDEAAIYFDPEDKKDLAKKLSIISENSSLQNQLSKKAESRSKQFKWEKAADQVMEILNNHR